MITKRSEVQLTPKTVYDQARLIEKIENIIASIKEGQKIYEYLKINVNDYPESVVLEVIRIYTDAGWEISGLYDEEDDIFYLRLE